MTQDNPLYTSQTKTKAKTKIKTETKTIPPFILDGLPGYILIIALAFSLIGTFLWPSTMLTLAALLALYSAVRFVFLIMAFVRGLRHIKQAKQTDWYGSYQQADEHYQEAGRAMKWDDIHHIVIIPNYQEPLSILRQTLDNLAQSPEARHMSVVLAMEAAEPHSDRKARQLQAEFVGQFANVFYSVHPADLPGEMRCKSSNQSWAVREAKSHLVDQAGLNSDYIIVTTMDADTLWHRDYFTALAYHFVTDDQRYTRFWQAPIQYYGRIYEVSPLFRLTNVYSNTTELGYLAAGWWPSLPISSYSLSLRLLMESDYWDTNVIADEWHMYIKAFFANEGRVSLVPIYLPFLATAVTGSTFWQTLRKRYLQTLRHAWGNKEIGYTLFNIFTGRDWQSWRAWRTWRLFLVVSHDLLQASAIWLIITIGSQLPILLHPELREIMFSPERWRYIPFLMLQLTFVIVVILGIFCIIMDFRLRPARPTPPTRREHRQTLFGIILLPFWALAFVILPIIHAQLRLLFGKSLVFQVTTKGQ